MDWSRWQWILRSFHSIPDRSIASCGRFRISLVTLLALLLLISGCNDQTPRGASRSSAASQSSATDSVPENHGPQTSSTSPKAPPIAESKPSDAKTITVSKSETDVEKKPAPKPEKPAEPQPVFRPSDTRPKHNVQELERHGIRTYESKRLRLYTDIDPKIAETLPKFVDAVYDAWVAYLGPLPPNRERTEFQVTGYIMKDRELFAQLKLLPADLPKFLSGRHRGAEFWINEQEFDYYRRHLMLHEATHCYMTAIPDVQAPAWYMEGMAELFGTHRVNADGSIQFRVMPDAEENFGGLGRIGLVRTDIAAGRLLALNDIDRLQPDQFLENSNYGWAWALCMFLDQHPRYRDRFHELSRHTTGKQFEAKLGELFRDDLADMSTEWLLFATSLQAGYDVERAAVQFREGVPIARPGAPVSISVATDRGWQSSGVLIEKGKTYDLTASGEFTLSDKPVPWKSSPDGISIFYSEGRPIGRLVASIRASVASDEAPVDAAEKRSESMLELIPVGRHARFAAPITGTIYFHVNDFWRSLADNKGSVDIEIRENSPAGK